MGDVVLDGENVGQVTVITFGPQVAAGVAVDQLGGDADAVAGLANAALQGELDAEFAAGIGDMDGPALVNEGRVAGDDE